jgi:ribosomal protein L40E
MIKCQNCGAEIPDNAKFCGKCGTASIPNKNICKTCGAELPVNAKFCGKCGTPLNVTTSGGTASVPNINICKNCGAEMPASVKFCGKCGAPISSTSINQGTPNKADVNTSYVYQNTQNFAPPKIKNLTSKPAFWITVAAAIIILIIIISNSGGSSKRQSYQPGVTTSPSASSSQSSGNETPVICPFCQGTRIYDGKQCIFCFGTGYAPTTFSPQAPSGSSGGGTTLSSRRCIVCDGKGFLVEYPFGSHSYNMEFCLQCGKRDYPHTHKKCETCNGSGIQIR